jgi:PAS domain S-box-containing protein
MNAGRKKSAGRRREPSPKRRAARRAPARDAAVDRPIAATRAELGTILEMIGDAFVAFDRELNFTYVNERAEAVLERRAAELVGRNYYDAYPESRGSAFAACYHQALATGQPAQLEAYFAPWDRWFENRVYPVPAGLAVFFTEVTERKRAEEAVERERDFSNALLDGFPGVFHLCDENRRILRWNQNLERVTGYAAEDIAHMTPLDFVPPEFRGVVTGRIEAGFREGGADGEGALLARDGTVTPYYFTGKRILLGGEPRLIGMGIDISRRAGSSCR